MTAHGALPPEAVPIIPRGVRLHHDRVRDAWVLLAPERTLQLDPIGLAILREIDGNASLSQIIGTLAAKYDAPPDQIAGDVGGFIAGLMARRILEVQP